MKRTLSIIAAMFVAAMAYSQTPELKPEVFGLMNLEYPGLEKVKELHQAGQDADAAQALLDYYRGRKGIVANGLRDIKKVKISDNEKKWADEGLEHTFFVHYGYQPSYNYGKDIDWKFWPVKDMELRWQLHRHKWWVPMGKAYRVTGEEKYAEEWTKQYIDWIRKNPYDDPDKENLRFSWRPLEVSSRLQNQPEMFMLFIDSPAFTPEFLTEFLVNYHKHAEHILANYSDKGNHLLFEAQRVIGAGCFFPEFRQAETWRDSGVKVLNREIDVQVMNDGSQYELCPHYHLASINIFLEALETADINGLRHVFPQSYVDKVESMIMFYGNLCFPDYENPCFSDAKIIDKKEMMRNYRRWSVVYPENEAIKYWATDGKQGRLPEYLSKGFLTSGFFIFRNSWGEDATQMVVKAGPPAFWHNQPDNGTFELWYKGRNLFPDSGAYIYSGDEEVMKWRRWFRRTDSHNTVTLNNKNIDNTDSKTLLWNPDCQSPVLVTENEGYEGFFHRRSVFFVDRKYFAIVDEVHGPATGTVNLNYQMPMGEILIDTGDMTAATSFEAGSNMILKCFAPEGTRMNVGDGWHSPAYRSKVERKKISYDTEKGKDQVIRYITVIVPKEEPGNNLKIQASFIEKNFDRHSMSVMLKVGKDKKRILKYELQ